MNLLRIFNGKIELIAPVAFILLTFVYSISRTPFFDEAYAYLISNLSISEIFQITRIEGHPILWYLILKLTNIDINFYPYNILITNWLIASCLIVFIWKKAPFNNLIKFLITFSYPFFHYYGVVARPYGLSVLMLFLLCYFYKDSLKKPFLYSVLICIACNITAVCAFGAVFFCSMFLYDLLKEKNKKVIIKVFLILLVGFLLTLAQFVNIEVPNVPKGDLINNFATSVFNFLAFSKQTPILQNIFGLVGCILFFISIVVSYKVSKKALFFLLGTYFLLSLLFVKIYLGAIWHYYFYFIYLILALWLIWDKVKNNTALNIVFVLFLFLSIFSVSFNRNEKNIALDTKDYKQMLNFILKNEYSNADKAKLFCLDWYSPFSPGLLPYLKKENIKIYDAFGFDKTTFKSMRNTYKYRIAYFDEKSFLDSLDKAKTNYLITQNYIFSQGDFQNCIKFDGKDFYFSKNDVKIFFELVAHSPKLSFSIFKINYEK